MINRWRCAAALAAAVAVAGCGGSHTSAGAASPAQARSDAARPAQLAIILPASTNGPTTCTVYEPRFATQIVFGSNSLNVSGECQAWARGETGAGYLWGYQPTGAPLQYGTILVCHMTDPARKVTASVIEDTGFIPVTAGQRARSATACASILAAGWIVRQRPAS
jgi:hypothetical protein